MKNPDTFQNEQEVKVPHQGSEKNDLLVILSLLINNWYFFSITIIAAFFCARFYIGPYLASIPVISHIAY